MNRYAVWKNIIVSWFYYFFLSFFQLWNMEFYKNSNVFNSETPMKQVWCIYKIWLSILIKVSLLGMVDWLASNRCYSIQLLSEYRLCNTDYSNVELQNKKNRLNSTASVTLRLFIFNFVKFERKNVWIFVRENL